jgi:hypothetical protein
MLPVPHEYNLYGIYFSPLVVSSFWGIMAACLAAWLLNRQKMSRYLANPAMAFLSMIVLFTCIIATFIIPA